MVINNEENKEPTKQNHTLNKYQQALLRIPLTSMIKRLGEEEKEITLTELSRQTTVSYARTHKLIKYLKETGLTEIKTNGRSLGIKLTTKGHTLNKKIQEIKQLLLE